MNLPWDTTIRSHSGQRRFFAGISAAATFALPIRSHGQSVGSGGIDVQWEAPPECPDVNSVKLYAERLLGHPLVGGQSQRVAVQAKVRRNSVGNWEVRLSLSVGDRVEEMTLAAKRCRALADATALKAALASDPVAVVESIELPPTPPPSDSSAMSEPSAVISAPAPKGALSSRPSEPPSLRVALRATGGAGFGPLPGMAPGAGLFGSAQIHAFRAEFGGQVFWGADARYAELPNVGADFQLVSGIGRGCAMPSLAALTFPICLGVELGVMRGEGFGVAATQTSDRAWGAFVIGPALLVPLGQLVSFWLEADAAVPFLRPGFHVRNLETLFQAPPGGARAWAGLEMNLGR